MPPTPKQIEAAYAASGGKVKTAAAALGCCPKTVRRWRDMTQPPATEAPAWDVDPVPDPDLPVEDILDVKAQRYAAITAAQKAQQGVVVRMRSDEVQGILHFGDCHIDSDYCDVETLFQHVELVNTTPGLYAANIGDLTDNWAGNMQRLYSEANCSNKNAWRLAEHFIHSLHGQWLYFVGGNHDAWSGGGDPLQYILRRKVGHMQYHGCRLRLQFPNGREVRIWARHNFKGHSQYSHVFGAQKAALMGGGSLDHILINGHTHVSGYTMTQNTNPATGIDGGLIHHCIQVAAYKGYDDYAAKIQAAPHSFGTPACVTIIDPQATTERGLIKTDFDVQGAADYLTWRRKRAA